MRLWPFVYMDSSLHNIVKLRWILEDEHRYEKTRQKTLSEVKLIRSAGWMVKRDVNAPDTSAVLAMAHDQSLLCPS